MHLFLLPNGCSADCHHIQSGFVSLCQMIGGSCGRNVGLVRPNRERSGQGNGWFGFWMTFLHACLTYLILAFQVVQSLRTKRKALKLLPKPVTHTISLQHLAPRVVVVGMAAYRK